jgi:hypothetical protein
MHLEQVAALESALASVLGDAPAAGRDPGPAVAAAGGDDR